MDIALRTRLKTAGKGGSGGLGLGVVESGIRLYPRAFPTEDLWLVQLPRAMGVGLPGALVLKETFSWGPGMDG